MIFFCEFFLWNPFAICLFLSFYFFCGDLIVNRLNITTQYHKFLCQRNLGDFFSWNQFIICYFFPDCDDLNVGDVLKFTIHCYAYSQNKQQIPICKDDNDGLSYQVNCTPKLNVWAAKAAQELKNFAPAANRNNCFHKNESNSETVTKNSVWNISIFICK